MLHVTLLGSNTCVAFPSLCSAQAHARYCAQACVHTCTSVCKTDVRDMALTYGRYVPMLCHAMSGQGTHLSKLSARTHARLLSVTPCVCVCVCVCYAVSSCCTTTLTRVWPSSCSLRVHTHTHTDVHLFHQCMLCKLQIQIHPHTHTPSALDSLRSYACQCRRSVGECAGCCKLLGVHYCKTVQTEHACRHAA